MNDLYRKPNDFEGFVLPNRSFFEVMKIVFTEVLCNSLATIESFDGLSKPN